MEKFSKNIDGIRNMLKDLKAEKYAIVNPELVALDEYVKRLYLKVLCTVIQYENDPSEMQILYLKRIVNGISIDDTAEECMRKALEISTEDMQEFLSIMGKLNCKYYFAVDGIILSSLGKGNANGYDYLAEILELLEVNIADLEYICLITKSVLQQDSSFYDQAKELVNERVEKLDFTPYIKNFYSGVIADSESIIHYYMPEIMNGEKIKIGNLYTQNIVIFENMIIDILEEIVFKGCNEVCFINCTFTGTEYTYCTGLKNLKFIACRKVEIRNCKFSEFEYEILNIDKCTEVLIDSSTFCDCKVHHSLNGKGAVGIIINNEDANCLPKVILNKTHFKNCIGYAGNYNTIAVGIVSNIPCVVENCEFSNVWNYSYTYEGDYKLGNTQYQRLFVEKTENKNNLITGSATIC